MAKHPHYAFSKKMLPPGSKRVTKEDGTRVWVISGREYPHRRAYFEALQAAFEKSRIAAELKAKQTPADEIAVPFSQVIEEKETA